MEKHEDMPTQDDFVEIRLNAGVVKTRGVAVDRSAPETKPLPKGSCTIVHRGREILMENSPGKRIVSVKLDVSRTDKDPLGTAYTKLVAEFQRGGAPATHEVDLLAKWYDPKDSTVKVRLRIPHARYASWRENSFTSIASTRERQAIDDRIDIVFDDRLQTMAVVEAARAHARRATATSLRATPDGPGPVAVARRPDYRRQFVVTLMSACAVYALLTLGGLMMALSAVPLAFLIVHSCYFWRDVRSRPGRSTESMPSNARPTLEAVRVPQEWTVVRDAIRDHAKDRMDETTRAEMRIRGLLEAPTTSLNPIVVESTARIANGLRDLVAAHRAPAAIATQEEAATLAERLADSICALGVEAEDARVVAFRDAVFDFDAAARYIESRNDPILRIADDSTKP